LTEELLDQFEDQIESFSLFPSDGGRFEFSVNGELLYSKLQTRRHADPGEISDLLERYLVES